MAIARNSGTAVRKPQAQAARAVLSGAFQTQPRPNTPYRAATPAKRAPAPAPVRRAPTPAPRQQAPAPRPQPQVQAPSYSPRQQVVQQRAAAPRPQPTIQPRVSAPVHQPIARPQSPEPSLAGPPRINSALPTWGGGAMASGNTMPGPSAAYQQPQQPVVQNIVDPMSSQPPMAQPDPSLTTESQYVPLLPDPTPPPMLDGSNNPSAVDPTTAPPPIEPPPPSEDQWLGGDATYQDQTSQLRKAYSDYLSNQQLDRGQHDQSYQGSLRDLTARQQQDTVGLNDDFASRGLTNSGLYGQAFSDLQNRYDTNRAGLAQGFQGYQADQASQLSDYTNQQNTTTLSAKQEALSRRASKYNLA